MVDLRNRTAFAAGHAPGTLNFGIDGSFATYLGWLITWGTPVTLLGETADDVAEAQRELVRIGIDRPAAAATGGPEDWADGDLASLPDRARSPTSHRSATTARSSSSTSAATDEYESQARIAGAVNIPIHELPRRVDEVPAGEVWVHCAAATAPPSPPPCSPPPAAPWSPSTTPSTTPRRSACTWSNRAQHGDARPSRA